MTPTHLDLMRLAHRASQHRIGELERLLAAEINKSERLREAVQRLELQEQEREHGASAVPF